MEKICFNVLQIIEENQKIGDRFIYPTTETFKDIEEEFSILIDGVYYEVVIEKTDSFIWFSFDFGRPNPRDEHLTDIITGEKRENEREITEAELIQQFFCLYNYSTELFYISNIKKKNIIRNILKEKIKQTFSFSNILKTKEEFISILKEVNKITFTETRHLFSHDSKRRNALKDLTGIDAPKEFTIEANYEKSNQLNSFLTNLFEGKNRHELKDLIICGNDENDFEIVFNNDTFSKKIEIKNAKNENGKYIPNDIKENLLKELEK